MEKKRSSRPWFHEGLRFECRQCGNCCTGAPGFVYVTEEEIDKIAAFIGRSGRGLTKEHLRKVGPHYSLTEDAGNGDCCFLQRRDGRFGCSIYPVRPLQCRTWPFWPSNLRSPENWAETAEGCPGLNRGPLFDLKHIRACRNAKCWEDVPSCPQPR